MFFISYILSRLMFLSVILFLKESHVLVVHLCKVLSFVSLTGRRWIFTVARFSYCLVSCVSRKNFRRAFFMCKSQYVWSKYILSYDPYGLAHTIVKADVCRTERVDMSKSWKSRPALHSHDFVVYVLGQSSTKMLISSSLLDKQIIIITS